MSMVSTNGSPSVQEGVAIGSSSRVLPAALTAAARRLLKPELLDLVAWLHEELADERRVLLSNRVARQQEYDQGALPDYLPDEDHPEAHGNWRVAPLPPDLLRRRVEITGPINDTKMVINMLSRNAEGFRADAAMLDFEDSMKPSWANVLAGIDNLIGAVDGTLSFTKATSNGHPAKHYSIDADDMPLLMVRVRGLHLSETNVMVNGEPVSAGIFDLAASVFYTAHDLVRRRKTPKYYVPKVEHFEEARWWNKLFSLLEDHFGFARGTLRATFLIETLPAAFQMEEILYEIREHAAGLNVGRWDKIFSDIKVVMNHADRVLADRATISLNRPWMKNYALRLIRICHRHGAHAMGGMAAFTPGRTPERRAEQTRKVLEDKEFEAFLGHDGCWVSHPYFIGPALQAFRRSNQLDVIPDVEDRPVLLPLSNGPKTLAGLRTNIRVGIAYMRGWNADIGCVAWDDLMEDLATLEISRAQVRQWMVHFVNLDDGPRVTADFIRSVFREQRRNIESEIREAMAGQDIDVIEAEVNAYRDAAYDAEAVFLEPEFRPFLACNSPEANLSLEERRAILRDRGTCE